MQNPVVHFEIMGRDGAALIEFYRKLFDWPLRENQLPGWPHYGIMEVDQGIGGAVGTAEAAPEGAVLVYVEVDDLQACIDRASALDATVALPVTPVGGTSLSVAWLRDPQGNLVGLVQQGDHQPGGPGQAGRSAQSAGT